MHGYFPSFLDNSSTENKHDSRVFSHFILKGILSVLLFLGVAFIWETDSAMLSNVEDWTSQALTEEFPRSEEHTSELQSRFDLVCRLLLEKKNQKNTPR